MNSKWSIRRAITATVTLALLIWGLRPAAEHLLRAKSSVLLDQLQGRGCSYQEPLGQVHTLNPMIEYVTRHPDFYCPMWAADHLAAMRGLSAAEHSAVMNAFEEALKKKPESYDTGDGMIHYGDHLLAALVRLQPTMEQR